jgi:hypothetical protein
MSHAFAPVSIGISSSNYFRRRKKKAADKDVCRPLIYMVELYFGGSAPGWASSIGNVVAPAGAGLPSAGAAEAESGATLALLDALPAIVLRPVLF